MQLSQMLPRILPGFEHISRYWDPMHRTYAAKLLPGEYYVTVADEIIVGSGMMPTGGSTGAWMPPRATATMPWNS